MDDTTPKDGENEAAPIAEAKPKKKEKEKKPNIADEVAALEVILEELKSKLPKKEEAPPVVLPGKGKDKGKEKKEKKPKLSKKEKLKMLANRAEELKKEIAQAQKQLKEIELKRIEAERKANAEQEQRNIAEQNLRFDQLKKSCQFIRNLIEYDLQLKREAAEEQEWRQYLKCDGLPDPAKCSQMNTYLHLWDKVRSGQVSVDDASQRTGEVLKLLEKLQEFVETPLDVSEDLRKEWKNIRKYFRVYQQDNINTATYQLLRDIEQLHRIDLFSCDYVRTGEHFNLCIWLLIQTPIPEYNPRRPKRPRIGITFEQLKMKVEFPENLSCWAMFIRGLHVVYDHLSDTCVTFDDPQFPPAYRKDLFESTLTEWNNKVRYKLINKPVLKEESKPQEKKKKSKRGDTETLADIPDTETEVKNVELECLEPPEQEVKMIDYPFDIKTYLKPEPTPSSFILKIEDNLYTGTRSGFQIKLPKYELNLRKYRILGGVFYLDLFYQPPQPRHLLLNEITVTALQVPKRMAEVPFHAEYTPPPPPPPGAPREPEEIEREMREQELLLDKLIFVNMDLPSTVLWLDQPQVCYWDYSKNAWSTRDSHDVKYNEEKQTISFRTGCFGPFAFAVNKYINFPLQAWDLKAKDNNTIVLNITAAILVVEFTVQEDKVCVSQLQNAPTDALDHIVKKYYSLPELICLLTKGGVCIFPSPDTFCYVEGVCEKHWPTERHLYYNMAQISCVYNMAWSRWNLPAGRRGIVMQIRQLPTDALKMFFADLISLIKGTATMSMKKKLDKMKYTTINTLSQLLVATRVHSFS